MKIPLHKTIIIGSILLLMLANIYLFAQTVSLSDSIISVEKKTVKLREENQLLQEKYYTLNSIEHLERVAQFLGFTESAQSISVGKPDVAMR